MPSFFDADLAQQKQREQRLIQRMINLHQAVVLNRITADELREIASLSQADLEAQSADLLRNALDETNALGKLYTVLRHELQVDEIKGIEQLIDGLKLFDSEHGNYLPLATLAVDNPQTLALALNDFATFYDVFIQYMTSQKIAEEPGDKYAVGFDMLAAKSAWLRWKETRPALIDYDPAQAEAPGLMEKFLAGQLKKDEWLTDVDLERAVKILDLNQVGVHIVPFKAEDIGLVLHFERQKHQLDDPKTPYTIPLLVNLGEDDHSRIDSRGLHWTRLLITVDPRTPLPVITAHYTDELQLPETRKKVITETIRQALNYHVEQGSYTGDSLQIYTAFPECESPTIEVTGSGEQRDSFSCGYRALRGLVDDLVKSGKLENSERYQKISACKSSNSLRDFFYETLIGDQPLSEQSGYTYQSDKQAQYLIKPELVQGQLLAFSQTKRKPAAIRLDAAMLESLVAINDVKLRIKNADVVKQLTPAGDSLTLDIQELLDNEVIKAEQRDALAIEVIFATLSDNEAIKNLNITGTTSLSKPHLDALHTSIDFLPSSMLLASDDPELSHYLAVINVRNKLLAEKGLSSSQGDDAWQQLFDAMLFTIPETPTGGLLEFSVQDLGSIGFARLLSYVADNQSQLVDGQCPYHTISLDDASAEAIPKLLGTLKTHLQSTTPFIPFKQIMLPIHDLSPSILADLQAILPLLTQQGVEKLVIKTETTPNQDDIQTLVDFVQANKISTILTFSPPLAEQAVLNKLAELENAALANKRDATSPTDGVVSQDLVRKPVTLGKIGKAILHREGVGSLDVEVQAQQQQQVQQQVQTALDDDDLPEEDEIEEESFAAFTSGEKLLDRNAFIAEMHDFVSRRHPHLSPERCWDLITGEHAELFKYGIRKMTMSAAKRLVDNLPEVQFGLHPDNLPRGFSFQQDAEGHVVLNYTRVNPVINPNESPLTIQFTKPLEPIEWAGDALQFISKEQAKALYMQVFANTKSPKPTLDECISHFFFLKEPLKSGITTAQRLIILEKFTNGLAKHETLIGQQLKDLFEGTLSDKNMAAFSEILYEKGPVALTDLLASLQQIKEIKGVQFFASFKACFIDASNNLNELTSDASRAAMQKLLTLSPAEATWWSSLTEQHTSNLNYNVVSPVQSDDEFTFVESVKPGQRWANLAEMTNAFDYFCGQLEEVHPGLKLTQYCPLTNVVDMRVGLDRLVSTILPNAHDINEQFYAESLPELSLDALGPFYASRYEGYKWVAPELTLSLGAMTGEATGDIKFAEQGFSFRCDKAKISGNFSDTSTDSRDKKQAIFLRYIATFNHRAHKDDYIAAFDKIMAKAEHSFDGMIDANALIILAIFGTGKRGKNFSEKDIHDLVALLRDPNNLEDVPLISPVFVAWRLLRKEPIKPTIADVVAITSLALKTPEVSVREINNVVLLVPTLGDAADDYLNALTLLSRNTQGMSLITLHSMLINTKAYDFFLMPDDSMDAIEDTKIGIKLAGDQFAYAVRNDQRRVERGEMTLIELNDRLPDECKLVLPLTLEQLQQVKEHILLITSERGHTQTGTFNNPEMHAKDVCKLRAAASKLLAVCTNHTGDVTDENCVEKMRELLTQIEDCALKHGMQTTSDLLELLGNIDVASEQLPTVGELTQLIHSVVGAEKPDYNQLLRTVKAQLPEQCMILTNHVTAAPVDSGANLQSVLAQYMGDIREKFSAYKTKVDKALGEGFYDSLATSEGPKRLIKALDKIAEMPSLLRGMVEDQVRGVMLKIYTSVLNDGVKRIDVRNKETQDLLTKVMTKRLDHPVRELKDFNEFSKRYPQEIQELEQLLANLKQIKQKWPTSFNSLISTLDQCKPTDNSAGIESYPLDLLAKITGLFAKHFDATQSFPIDTFQAFFNVSKPSLTDIGAIIDVLEYKISSKVISLTDHEKQLLCKTALKYCQTKPGGAAADFTTRLLALKQSRPELPELFSIKLNLLLVCDDLEKRAREIDDQVNKLNPSLIKPLFNFFEKERARDFFPFLDALSAVSEDSRDAILTIVLSAAQKGGYTVATMQGVIDRLQALGEPKRLQLLALYHAPTHPDLDALDKLLAPGVSLDLDRLQEEYDRDPSHQRQEEGVLDAQFDTSKLAKYLDNTRDLNYDRPLLLSQRQELQRWFMYINTIGKDRPIHTKPWDTEDSAPKAIKDMSHAEIQGLLKHYRALLQDTTVPKERLTKARLECIAILREVMYRGTGRFPRSTQILYLLNALQAGKDFIAQIQTGQGKSLTAALAAAMANLEGKTADICTSNLFLASEGLEENKPFFDYLGMPIQLINAGSGMDDYQAGAIHYSSMSELALYRSKMQLRGKVFPKDATLIADEVDFSTLDDTTRFRYAMALDPVSDPYKSPYTWIYEALVQFVDSQTTPLIDDEFMQQAQVWLQNSAKSKDEKTQLKNLAENPEVYKKRLETWLIAAGKTGLLAGQEQTKFRVVTLEHPKFGPVSKACILTGGRPNIQAEFSNGIQQFLHVRLRQKYRQEIDAGKMPDFLVEPEKTYVTSLNSKILMNTYAHRLGMSGTVGSPEEIKEQYAKYGFRFVDIPPFTDSNRVDLAPILTNPKLITNATKENADHIKRLVSEIVRHISREGQGRCAPMLILCADKSQGEQINQALQRALDANPGKFAGKYEAIQQYYSSEQSTPDARNKEERDYKERAGLAGMITISTVFDRGTDIKTDHSRGLYTIQTYVDTEPYSAEDLERSKRQKIGRSGRAGQIGFTRLIAKRSEFTGVYQPKQLRNIPQSVEGLDKAIRDLNTWRNKTRANERAVRESFDDVKDIIFQQFSDFINVVNETDEKIPKQLICDKLLTQWNLALKRIDDRWEQLQHDVQFDADKKLTVFTEFACDEWNDLAKKGGVLEDVLILSSVKTMLPEQRHLVAEEVVGAIRKKHPALPKHYIKEMQLHEPCEPTISADTVYCDLMATDSDALRIALQHQLKKARSNAVSEYFDEIVNKYTTQAYNKKLQGKFNLSDALPAHERVKQALGALYYLRYKAMRDGNLLAYASLSQECKAFVDKMQWAQNSLYTEEISQEQQALINGIIDAQQAHFSALTNHRGSHEARKGDYLRLIMAEWQQSLPAATAEWKQASFTKWWKGREGLPGQKEQVANWLTNYRDKWWSRGWVSSDRKQIVTDLLSQLANPDMSPSDILAMISAARKQILADDVKYKRRVSAGVSGRLFQFLNEIETRVLAASDAVTLDNNVKHEFADIKTMLSQFASRLKLPDDVAAAIESIDIDGLIVDEAIQVDQVARQYKQISALFNYIPTLVDPEARFEDKDMDNCVRYCQEKQTQLVSYFSQCDQLKVINEPRSVQVYRAASEAGACFINQVVWRDASVALNLPDEFNYQDALIKFKVPDPSAVKDNPFFKQINNEKSYVELLSAIEKTMVEHATDSPLIKFTQLTLLKNNCFGEDGFKLKVTLLLDGVETAVNYHFNLNTGAVYCDNQTLSHLDEPLKSEPDLNTPVLQAEMDDITSQLQSLKSHGQRLIQDTSIIIARFKTALERAKPDQISTVVKEYRSKLQELQNEPQDDDKPNKGP